jgi:hypothetical protein
MEDEKKAGAELEAWVSRKKGSSDQQDQTGLKRKRMPWLPRPAADSS